MTALIYNLDNGTLLSTHNDDRDATLNSLYYDGLLPCCSLYYYSSSSRFFTHRMK